MPYAVGSILALLTALFLRIVGFDRDRAVYPTLLIVTASYYVLFAVMDGAGSALRVELVALIGFALVAVLGFRASPWWIVGAFMGHGVFDLVHDRLVSNPGVPAWWPTFCLSFDVGFAACLAWLLLRRHVRS